MLEKVNLKLMHLVIVIGAFFLTGILFAGVVALVGTYLLTPPYGQVISLAILSVFVFVIAKWVEGYSEQDVLGFTISYLAMRLIMWLAAFVVAPTVDYQFPDNYVMLSVLGILLHTLGFYVVLWALFRHVFKKRVASGNTHDKKKRNH